MQAPPILDHAATLADLTRCRILRALERQELTVGELCAVLQLPQSTVSRHLKVLSADGWLRARRQGTSHLYRLPPEALERDAGRLWQLVRSQLVGSADDAQDARRLRDVLADRGTRSQAFFSSTAGRWDQLRTELFGPRFDLLALAALIDPDQRVGDLACGTGQVAAALAPFVREVEAVDRSPEMLAAARDRLGAAANVRIHEGELEHLPLADAVLDAAVLMLALPYVAEPARALAEARRVLRPGGRLLLVDMLPHEREDYRHEMGHVWLGFDADEMTRLLAEAGFEPGPLRALPTDPGAKGPALFATVAGVPAATSSPKPEPIAAAVEMSSMPR